MGRAPQAVRVFYRIATWFCKSAVTGATIRAGRAGCQPPRKASFRGIPGYGVEPRSSILEALGPSVIRTGGDDQGPRPDRLRRKGLAPLLGPSLNRHLAGGEAAGEIILSVYERRLGQVE